MAVSKHRKEHKSKVVRYKANIKAEKELLKKLYVKKINEMILEQQNKKA
jgi:hypothetical protein